MKKEFNIAIAGLGQIGIFLYNELKRNQKTIQLLTGKKIKIVGLSARNKNKKRRYPINKKIFFKDPIKMLKSKQIDILFECIGLSDGMSKRCVELALNKKIPEFQRKLPFFSIFFARLKFGFSINFFIMAGLSFEISDNSK